MAWEASERGLGKEAEVESFSFLVFFWQRDLEVHFFWTEGWKM